MALRLFISGIEYRIATDYQIREKVGQSVAGSVNALVEDGQDVPVSQQSIEIRETDGTTVIYKGLILAVDHPVWSSREEAFRVGLECKSLDVIFDRRIINDAYTDMTTTEIVNAIYTDYLVEEGLTLGTIGTFTRHYEKYVASALSMRKVLDELGDAVQAAAYVTPTGEFCFCSLQEFMEVTPPTHITKLQKKENGIKLRTVQRLTGANEETSLQTSSTVWATNQSNVLVDYQVSSISAATINGSPVNVGIKGVDEADTTKTFLTRYGDNIIVLNPSATVKPTASDIVAFLYYGFFSVEVIQENEALKTEIAGLSGTSGKIESVQVDTSITSFADGEAMAADLLDENGEREETITGIYRGLELDKLTLLNAWTLDYPDLDITGKYVIVDRSISYFGDVYNVPFTLKNKNFYNRSGTVLDKNDKQLNNLSIRIDDAVFKTSVITDQLTLTDEFTFSQGTVIMYPSGGSDLWIPSTLPGFYPTGG